MLLTGLRRANERAYDGAMTRFGESKRCWWHHGIDAQDRFIVWPSGRPAGAPLSAASTTDQEKDSCQQGSDARLSALCSGTR